MLIIREIPLDARPQRFSIMIGQVTYRLRLSYQNVPQGGGWLLDIATSTDVPLINGIPLVPGIDLLAQYGYLGLGFQLYIQTEGDPSAAPTFDNLGTTSHLYAVLPA